MQQDRDCALFKFRRTTSSFLDQADNQCQDYSADYRDDDGVDHATLSRKTEGSHNESTHYRANDADHDVHNGPVTGATHELPRDPARDETYDYPPENKHVFSPPLG